MAVCLVVACLWSHPRGPREGICKAECGVESRVATLKAGAAAHQDVVVLGASGEVLAAARSNRAHTPRRKALMCVEGGSLSDPLCARTGQCQWGTWPEDTQPWFIGFWA